MQQRTNWGACWPHDLNLPASREPQSRPRLPIVMTVRMERHFTWLMLSVLLALQAGCKSSRSTTATGPEGDGCSAGAAGGNRQSGSHR